MEFKSFISCGKCDDKGYIIDDGFAKKCSCRKEYETELKFFNKIIKSGLLFPNSTEQDYENIRDYNFDDYVGTDVNKNIDKLKKFTLNFNDLEKPYYKLHQYWCGEQGCQKSYTAKGLCSILAKKGNSVYYTFAKDLIALIMSSERDEEKQNELEYIQNVDLLILDEFQKDRLALYGSGYKQNIFTPWIKKRLEVIKKSTIFISNDTIRDMKQTELGDLLGDVIDRETKYAQFTFTDNYGHNMNLDDFENELNDIWG